MQCYARTNREGDGTPLQCSCLENPMDRGAWQAAVHGVARSWARLSDFTFAFHFHALEKEMATRSSVLAWRIPETVGPRLWGVTESDTTEATQQQQQARTKEGWGWGLGQASWKRWARTWACEQKHGGDLLWLVIVSYGVISFYGREVEQRI